ncbi:MAG: hypothetical protein N3A02_07130, partial [Rectinema sp.]|nr:hypothetical protein [Rectinema sp.]
GRFLEEMDRIGLLQSIEQAMFADIARPRTGGKGLDGLVEKDPDYYNPAEEALETALGLKGRE